MPAMLREPFRLSPSVLVFFAFMMTPIDAIAQGSVAPAIESSAVHDDTNPQNTNRLAKESSPYLLQHAHNPVDWYPWGEEAFERAKRENKMIFLSVGYAACHWCHVMERESFVDPEIAKSMNENFVCIKVDREERPDVDQIYMLAVQLVSGRGGWPMSVFLTPDAKPFWGGTYFPARNGDRGASTGFLSILDQVKRNWMNVPDAVRSQADKLTDAIKEQQKSLNAVVAGADNELSREDTKRVLEALADEFDPKYGGFRYSDSDPNLPKFPEASKLVFLIRQMYREDVSAEELAKAKQMLTATLDAMISGAMFDALGGGFHRYSVDRRWQIPHFEKMLYDNGQLASVYAEAYKLTGREEYRRVSERTCDFVIRDLTATKNELDGAAFYSSLDADSEGEEGAFYRWTPAELANLATQIEGFSLVENVYRMNGDPNFESEYFVPDPGRTLSEIAKEEGGDFATLEQQLSVPREQWWQERERREHPPTDTKILTAWNGLMIAGLADAGRLLDRPDYVQAAAHAANFMLREMPDADGRLRRTYAAGKAKLNAYIDDYAFLVSGLIALHQATGEAKWIEAATRLTDTQLRHFWDEDEGGFYFTSDDHSSLIVRLKDPLDGAIPSGASVAMENLAYLAELTGEPTYHEKLKQSLASVQELVRRSPANMTRVASIVP